MKPKNKLAAVVALALTLLAIFLLSTEEAQSDFDEPLIPSSPVESVALVPSGGIVTSAPKPKPAATPSIKEMVAAAFPDAPVMIAVAHAESRYDPYAKNPHSTATGVFQILIGTWYAYDCSGSRTNPADNIACARKIYDSEGTRPWASSGPW